MRGPSEIAPRLYRLQMGIFGQVSNAYIWISDAGPVVVDAGLPGDGPQIIAALTALGYGPQNVVAVLLTHGDIDHIGGVAALQRWCSAPIAAGAGDLLLTKGCIEHATRIQTRTVVGRLLARTYRRLGPIIGEPEPFEMDVMLTAVAETTPGGLTPIPTPGHTSGHTSYLDRQRGVLFTGDAIINLGRLSPPLDIFTEDTDETRRSIKRLAELDFEIACLGHGSPIQKDAGERVRAFAASL